MPVVKLLVESEGVDINATDNSGLAPVSWAATCGHLAIVEVMLKCKNIDINTKDMHGYTPLTWAASKGY
jgi:ankyrin repeat protein